MDRVKTKCKRTSEKKNVMQSQCSQRKRGTVTKTDGQITSVG